MEKTISFNGQPLFYQVAGSGPVVVFIHGIAEDGNIWTAQAEKFTESYRVIMPDLPGSGRSAMSGSFSMEDLAESVKAILDAEKVQECILIGHSMGGYITLAFAGLYPGYLAALGLFHSSAFADNEDKIKTREKNIAFIEKHGTLPYLEQSTPTLFSDEFKEHHPDVIESLIATYAGFDPKSLAGYQEAMKHRPDTTQVLKEFVKPLLFIIGKHDNAVPFADSMKQCHLPQVAYIHILDKSGHMGMLEETGKANEILETFFFDVYRNSSPGDE